MLRVHSMIYLGFFLGLLLLASCDPHIAYEKNTRINDCRWNRDSVAQFDVHIVDASQPYEVSVTIRHNNFYPYNNLVFSLEQRPALKDDTTGTVELSLAKSDGRWIGQSAGNLYLINHTVLERYHFPDTGMYQFSVKHHMEDHQLRGITDVGLKIAQKP
ncbi:gliding motility lipoprotein GldH [Sphingobacterium sp. lm-10]|uniref:gliding motility lipoprotein GldH n=1 Tax=Sphingobacterium sp. lm-10 TaxID=2944904 RepID=UPI0020211E54|nr:gliding motility lipoprotein GldH [Sphingobacterium sp. lm-10]MCL7988445.1 gliding motility lipoprotein GldH [Sphingobacterium sp. lm-10]